MAGLLGPYPDDTAEQRTLPAMQHPLIALPQQLPSYPIRPPLGRSESEVAGEGAPLPLWGHAL